ncbi:PREDICTED: 39S ribosomal protein L51, mitochondrial, partial [Apaloderma vittatum]|uniref:39S ribosomal protein L51, mitochondrial n=1 Tax=Apaloderma vittatum TaxID=57397 RepID=UPI0005219957
RKQVDRWTKKRALFGVYDNVGILGLLAVSPPCCVVSTSWEAILFLLGSPELQRCIRKKQMVGDRMFVDDYNKLTKRIRYLYRRFNRTGKHR